MLGTPGPEVVSEESLYGIFLSLFSSAATPDKIGYGDNSKRDNDTRHICPNVNCVNFHKPTSLLIYSYITNILSVNSLLFLFVLPYHARIQRFNYLPYSALQNFRQIMPRLFDAMIRHSVL